MSLASSAGVEITAVLLGQGADLTLPAEENDGEEQLSMSKTNDEKEAYEGDDGNDQRRPKWTAMHTACAVSNENVRNACPLILMCITGCIIP